MGHPEPFNMKMIGVGNEQWGPQYIERYKIFAKAIKDKYPDIADCYRVRNLGLPNNALVFLIEHYNGLHRTMLVFGGAVVLVFLVLAGTVTCLTGRAPDSWV